MKEQKIYGYARVSSKEQNEDRQIVSLLNQGVMRENIFIDKQTGKNFDRPAYKRLLKLLDNHSVLFIKSIDRLGRNYEELNLQWRFITKEKQADIVVIDMPLLDTRKEKNLLGTFISDLVLSLLSFVSETEREMIRQRQAEGIAAARSRGVKFGRPQIAIPGDFEEICSRWKLHELSLNQAASLCKMSRTTFYRKALLLETNSSVSFNE